MILCSNIARFLFYAHKLQVLRDVKDVKDYFVIIKRLDTCTNVIGTHLPHVLRKKSGNHAYNIKLFT